MAHVTDSALRATLVKAAGRREAEVDPLKKLTFLLRSALFVYAIYPGG